MRGVALNSTVLFILLQYLISFTAQRPEVNRYSKPEVASRQELFGVASRQELCDVASCHDH